MYEILDKNDVSFGPVQALQNALLEAVFYVQTFGYGVSVRRVSGHGVAGFQLVRGRDNAVVIYPGDPEWIEESA